MTSEQKRELENAIKSNKPLGEIVALLRQYKAQGITQSDVYSFLETWHQTGADDVTDDRILEVADFVAGFCSPPMKVWDTEKAKKS